MRLAEVFNQEFVRGQLVDLTSMHKNSSVSANGPEVSFER